MAVGQQLDISSTVSGGLPKPLPDDVCKTYDVTSKWDPVRAFLRRSLVRVSVHGVLRGEENVDDRNRGSRL